MRTKRAFLGLLLTVNVCLIFLMGCARIKVRPSEQTFSFAVLADPRDKGDTWKNALQEIRDRTTTPETAFTPAELVVVAGDMDPLVSRYEDFLHVFADADTRPVFLPVIGNHEFENGGTHFRHARDVLIPSIPGAVRRHATSCDYYLDHRNVRIIAVDGYTDLGKDGVINDEGRQWVEQVIKATPASIDHIFVSFHEPAFPRVRHVGDSFDQDPERRNAFWRMLLGYRDRVRAVLVGHTHSYYRMRVLDPAGTAASDTTSFPDEVGGIYQIDAGAAGNSSVNTIVQVQIEDTNVLFRVLKAETGANKPFTEIDKWRIVLQP
jgi:hypothetical protein